MPQPKTKDILIMHKTVLSTVSAVTLLSACGGSSNPFDGGTDPIDPSTDPEPAPVIEASIEENANGTLTLSFDGETFTLPEPNEDFGTEPAIISGDPDTSVFGELNQTSDYYAVAGRDGDEFFAAVDGTIVTPPSASAAYSGRYEVVTSSGSERGNVSLNYDFATSELTGADSRVSLDATATSEGILTGNITVDSATVGYSGGFYGAGGEFAGAFVGTDFSGILYGEQ